MLLKAFNNMDFKTEMSSFMFLFNVSFIALNLGHLSKSPLHLNKKKSRNKAAQMKNASWVDSLGVRFKPNN